MCSKLFVHLQTKMMLPSNTIRQGVQLVVLLLHLLMLRLKEGRRVRTLVLYVVIVVWLKGMGLVVLLLLLNGGGVVLNRLKKGWMAMNDELFVHISTDGNSRLPDVM